MNTKNINRILRAKRPRKKGRRPRSFFTFIVLLLLIAAGVAIYNAHKDTIKPYLDAQLSNVNSIIAAATAAEIDTPETKTQTPQTPIDTNEIRVHFVDLGQADAILIQSNANAVLIDGGEFKTRNTLIAYLREQNIDTLDYVVATHPHSDHIGGLAEIIRRFHVKDVVMPNATNNTAAFEHLLAAIEQKNLSITVPNVGDKISAGIIEFIVLAPNPNEKHRDLNDASIVLRMVHGNTAFLFTGDAEVHSERKILAAGLDVGANVLKAGHHGSRTSTSQQFLDAVRPHIVVVMCGRVNSYGHPHREFLELVTQARRNITLLRTDELGTIIIGTNGQEILYTH